MRPEHFHETSLKVRVPRGNEGYWQIICQLHRSQGTFTVADIDDQSCVNAQLIRKYIRLLIAGGFVEQVTKAKAQFVAPAFQLLKWPSQAPRVRADGSIIKSTGVEHLWTAIRNLKTFGLKDLVFAAATTDVKPSHALAKRYVTYLTTAGYLTVTNPNASNAKRVWRLKPGMNTGPLPPSLQALCADGVLYDRNLKAFVGTAVALEVSI